MLWGEHAIQGRNMSARAELEGIANPSGAAATPERAPAGGVRWVAGGLLVGIAAMYGLFGTLIYIAVTALA